ncbi:MAG: PRD domain-containing protein [Clostridium sp.]|uniref:BglG family transcription antiterminator LicT n=1 Tax=Clostridium sp. TaxID=1506 RepID=UPI00290806A6|nr:PRD domain-containing protein [Clostridium sp.]MDU5111831.1 PRD domain-containing protein [Clostridium sp.]
MIIKKIFNNNSILALNSDKREVVVMGRGIGFRKSVGEEIDLEKVEKTFILKEKDTSEKFKMILEDVPKEIIYVSYDIIEYAKNILNVEISEYIYITLTDHISNTIKLYKEGFNVTNAIIWEIKKFYPKEFEIGLKSLNFIEEELDIKLPEDEAANIALHLINSQVNSSYKEVEDVAKQTKMINDILNIVRYTYNIKLDDTSLSYDRFITHLRFFFKRLSNKNNSKEENLEHKDDFLLKQVKEKYKDAYKCMLKIEDYLEKDLDDEEKLYLTVHIQRITSK